MYKSKQFVKCKPEVFYSFETGSKDWHQGRRDSPLLCTSCRTYENKHGCLPAAPKSAGAPFMFKPVKEEEEVNSKHGMRTRRSRAPVSLRLTDHSNCHIYYCSLRYKRVVCANAALQLKCHHDLQQIPDPY